MQTQERNAVSAPRVDFHINIVLFCSLILAQMRQIDSYIGARNEVDCMSLCANDANPEYPKDEKYRALSGLKFLNNREFALTMPSLENFRRKCFR